MSHGAGMRPAVSLIGDLDHPELADATALVKATSRLDQPVPEVIVIAHSRPNSVPSGDIERLRQTAPLAGVVALVGSWCEGETRTGRPTAGMQRLYWYEFPTWWQHQLELRAAGRCPDWAQPATTDFASLCTPRQQDQDSTSGCADTVVIDTPCWETASCLSDVLRVAGFLAERLHPGNALPPAANCAAGIWDGGQLDDLEAERLAAFCRRLTEWKAPVIALLDFPRRDRCELARKLGATAVLGKPWRNRDLIMTLRHSTDCPRA